MVLQVIIFTITPKNFDWYLFDVHIKMSDNRIIQDTKSLLKEQENFFNSQIGSKIVFEVDWSFTTENDFKSTNEYERHNKIKSLNTLFNRGLNENDKSLLKWLEPSERATTEFKKKVKSIKIKFETNINPKHGNSYYQVDLNGTELLILVQQNCYDYTDGWGLKVDKELGLNVKDEVSIRDVTPKVAELVKNAADKLQTSLTFEIDWSFTKESSFISNDEYARNSTINGFETVVRKGLFEASNALLSMLEQSKRGMAIFKKKVKGFKLSYVQNVDYKVGNSYYSIELIDGFLVIKINLNCYDYTDGWYIKCEKVLDMNILDEIFMRDCIKLIDEHEVKLNQYLDASFEVDWDSFVTSNEFKSYDEYQRKSMINGINTVISKGLNDTNNGLMTYINKSKRFHAILKNSINKITIKMDKNIDYKYANNYYSIDKLENELFVVVNLSCYEYTDGWGFKIDRLLDINAIDETNVFLAESSIKNFESQLESIVKQKIFIDVNWDSMFTQQFKVNDEYQRKSLIEGVVGVIQKGVFDSQGLIEFIKSDPKLFTKSVGKILIQFSENINNQVGNSYYSIEYLNGSLIATFNPNLMNYTDSWVEKTKYISSQMKNFNGKLPLKNPSHCYLTIPELKGFSKKAKISEHSYLKDYDEKETSKKETPKVEPPKKILTEIQVTKEKPIIQNVKVEKSVKQDVKVEKPVVQNVKVENPVILEKVEVKKEIEVKLDPIVGLEQQRILENCKRYQDDLRNSTQNKVVVKVNWKFMNHKAFIQLNNEKKKDFINLLDNYLYSIVYFFKNSCTDNIDKESITKIEEIVFYYDPDKSINDKIPNTSNHFSIKLEKKSVIVSINLTSDYLNGYEEKINFMFKNGVPKAKVDLENSLKDATNQIKQQFKLDIQFMADLDFVKDEKFEKIEYKTQIEAINRLKNIALYYIFDHVKNSSYDEIELENWKKIKKIILTYDPKSQIKGKYEFSLKDQTLKLQISLSNWDISYLEDISGKLDPIFNLRVAKGIRDFNNNIKQYENKLFQILQKKIPLKVDWKFTESKNFTDKPLDKYTDIINRIYNYHYYYITDALANKCHDEIGKKAVFERVASILFRYDPLNSNKNNYSISLDKDNLVVSLNLDQNESGLHDFFDRLDPVFNLRIDIAKRDGLESLKQYQNRLNDTFKVSIPIEIDWEFTKSEIFLKRDIKEYTTIMSSIWNSLAYYATDILVNLFREKFPVEIAHKYIKSFVLTYDATNKQDAYAYQSNENEKYFNVLLQGNKIIFVTNLNDYTNHQHNLSPKLEPILEGLQARKEFEANEEKLSSKYGIKVKMNWDSFLNQNKFKIKSNQERKIVLSNYIGYLNTIENALSEIFKNELGKKLFKEKVKEIELSCSLDSNSPLKMNYEKNTIYIEFNLNLKNLDTDTLYLEFSNLTQILVLVHIDYSKIHFKNISSQFLTLLGKNLNIEVDWSFTQKKPFMSLTPFEMRRHIEVFSKKNISHYIDSIIEVFTGVSKSQFCSKKSVMENITYKRAEKKTYPGFILLSKILNTLSFEIDCENKQPKDGSLNFNKDTTKVIYNLADVCKDIQEYWVQRLEILFDLMIKNAEYDFPEFYTDIKTRFSSIIPLTISFDKIIFSTKEFTQREPQIKYKIVRSIFFDLITTICDQLYQIATHPIGKKTIVAQLSTIDFSFDPKNSIPSFGRLEHTNKTIKLSLNLDSIQDSVKSDAWKSRIEFLLNIIVEIALYDTASTIKELEAKLKTSFGRDLVFKIDTLFTDTKQFKSLPEKDQSLIVTNLCTLIATQTTKDLISISKYKIGKTTVNQKIKKIILSCDPLNTLSKEGSTVVKEDLIITKNLNSPVDFIPLDIFWKTLDILGINNTYSQEQSFEEYTSICNQFEKEFQKKIPIIIDWESFLSSKEFTSLSTSQRNQIIVQLSTQVIKKIFFGPEGLPGFLRFAKSDIHRLVSSINISVDPKSSSLDPYVISGQSDKLFCKINLKDITNQLLPCRLPVEKALNLREIKVKAAMEYVINQLNNQAKNFKITTNISIDWERIIQHPSFKSTPLYIEMIDYILTTATHILFGKYGGIQNTFKETLIEINKTEKLVLILDLDDKVRKNKGKYTANYIVTKSSNILNIQSNYNNKQEEGCGDLVEFCLTPSLAQMKEDKETERLRREEMERIRREEERKMRELEEKRREPCRRCDGTLWIDCAHCNGKGYFHRPGNTCKPCKGAAGHKCTQCKGTGKKYPNL